MKILLNSIRIFATHGVLPMEHTVGAWYTVDLQLTTDFTKAMISDDIDDTLDYSGIYAVVEKEMQTRSKLVEHVAGRVIEAVFESFPAISAIHLRLVKENPPIPSFKGQSCGVDIQTTREEWLEIKKKSAVTSFPFNNNH